MVVFIAEVVLETSIFLPNFYPFFLREWDHFKAMMIGFLTCLQKIKITYNKRGESLGPWNLGARFNTQGKKRPIKLFGR